MVTASHNPPAYNGYKVYWGNGAQIIPPHDTGIAAAIAKIGRSDELPMPDARRARARAARDRSRRGAPRSLPRRRRSRCARSRSSTAARSSIAYTPLHGVGARVDRAARSRAPASRNVHTEPVAARARPRFPDRRVPESRGEGRDGSRPRARARRSTPTSCSRTIPTPIASRVAVARRRRRLSPAHRRSGRRAARRLPARGVAEGQADGRDDDRVVAAAVVPREGRPAPTIARR